jgi:hypothetical protein
MTIRERYIEELGNMYLGGDYIFFVDSWSPDILVVQLHPPSAIRTVHGYITEVKRIPLYLMEDREIDRIKEILGPTPKEQRALEKREAEKHGR